MKYGAMLIFFLIISIYASTISSGENSSSIVFLADIPIGSIIWDVDWNPKNQLLTVGLRNGTILSFDRNYNVAWVIDSNSVANDLELVDVEWDPQGMLIAAGYESTGYYHGMIVIYDYETNQFIWKISCNGAVNRISWSPDGAYVAFTCSKEHKVYVYTRNGQPAWETEELDGWTDSVAWSTDGKYLAVGVSGSTGRVYIYNRSGFLVRSKSIGRSLFGLSWSPDDRYISVSSAAEHKIYILNTELEIIASSPDLGSKIDRNKWGPFDLIATGDRDGILHIIGVNGTILYSEKLSDGWILSVDWYKESNITYYLAVASNNGHVYIYKVTRGSVFVNIYSDVDASIYVDGEKIGSIKERNWYNFTLSCGRHNITVANNNLGSYVVLVSLEPGEEITIIKPLTKSQSLPSTSSDSFIKGLVIGIIATAITVSSVVLIVILIRKLSRKS